MSRDLDIDIETMIVNDRAIRMGLPTVACVRYNADGTCEQVVYTDRLRAFMAAEYDD